MADSPELGFSVDTSELEAATKSLDDLSAAAGRAEEAAGRTGRAGQKMASDYVPAAEKAKTATDGATSAAERYIKQLQVQFDMLGKSSTAQAAYRVALMGGTEAQQQAAAALATLIDKRKENLETQALEESGLRRSSKAFGDFNLFTAGATRELIVLGHEALSGNFSRMPGSLLVLMEHTGGLRAALAALATPMGIVGTAGVAAFGAITYEVWQGRENLQRYNEMLAMTGGAVGVTRGQLDQFAVSIRNSTGASIQSSREMLLSIAESGRVSVSTLREVSEAATRYAEASHQDSDKVAADFAKMGDGVAKWAEQHNQSMHFMDAADYARVKSLEDAGNKTEAMRLVSRRLSEQLATKDSEDVGVLAKTFHDLEKSIGGALEKMRQWGAGNTKEERFKVMDFNVQRTMKDLQNPNLTPEGRETLQTQLKKQMAERSALSKQIETETKQQIRSQQEAEATEASIATQKTIAAYASNAEKRAQAIAKINAQYFGKNGKGRSERITDASQLTPAMIAAHGGDAAATMREYNAGVEALNTEYKDPKPRTAKVNTAVRVELGEMASAQTMVAEAEAKLKMLDDMSEERLAKLVPAQRKILELQMQLKIDDPKYRHGGMSDAQINAAIAEYQKAVDPQQKELEARLQSQKRQAAAKIQLDTTTKWNLSDAKTLDKYQEEANMVGASAEQRKVLAAAMAIEEDRRSAIAQMMEKTGLQNEEELTKQYPQQVAAINAAADARQNRMIPALEQEIALSQQWSTGWKNAFAAYQDSAHNNATAAASVFNTMTNSMQSTLLNFFNTGKLGWKSFASAILVECERIMVAKMAAGLLSSATSFFSGGGNASTAGGVTASSSGYSFQGFGTSSTDFKLANGGAFASGVQFYANGDVFNSPTMFSHSGGLGVLGEAGPEAVMPLTRGSDGKLGVKASGGSGGGTVTIQQNFYLQQDGTTTQTGDAGQLSSVTQQMSAAMLGIAKGAILQEMQPGGSIARLYGTKQ